MSKFPQLTGRRSAFKIIEPNMPFTTGPFTVIPAVANHGDNSTPSSVIYCQVSGQKDHYGLGLPLLT